MRLALERAQAVAEQPVAPESLLQRLWRRLRGKND